ncbi:MAG: hypothetical protein OEO77_05490 [Acidimicrobiia bacterium]|nr:hypothetical protein [Acidimicrobiia bacterium]
MQRRIMVVLAIVTALGLIPSAAFAAGKPEQYKGRYDSSSAQASWWNESGPGWSSTELSLERYSYVEGGTTFSGASLNYYHYESPGGETEEWTNWWGWAELTSAQYALTSRGASVNVAVEISGEHCVVTYGDEDGYVYECDHLGPKTVLVDATWTASGRVFPSNSNSMYMGPWGVDMSHSHGSSRTATVQASIDGASLGPAGYATINTGMSSWRYRYFTN